jgi:hypothetical protein
MKAAIECTYFLGKLCTFLLPPNHSKSMLAVDTALHHQTTTSTSRRVLFLVLFRIAETETPAAGQLPAATDVADNVGWSKGGLLPDMGLMVERYFFSYRKYRGPEMSLMSLKFSQNISAMTPFLTLLVLDGQDSSFIKTCSGIKY